jgi:hypothetical protein
LNQIKDQKIFDELIQFINAREFKRDDPDVFATRKKRFVINLKIISSLFAFGCTTILSFFSMSPLTDTQKAYVFKENEMYLFWLMNIHVHVSVVISSFLAMTATFLLYSLINAVSTEFKVLGDSFNKLLSEIDDEMSEEKALEVLEEFKEYVKYYDKLLK